MKFTNEEAFEKLKGMLTNNDKKPLRMSEKSVERQIEILLPMLADEETELDDFASKLLPSLEVMNSNAEYDNSNNYKKLKKELEEQLKDKPNPKGKTNEPDDKQNALEQRLALLEAELNAAKKEKALGDVRSRISSGLLSKGVKDKEWIEALMSEITISEDTDVEAKVDSLVKFYNKGRASVDYDITPDSSAAPSKLVDKQTEDFFADIKKDREAQAQREKSMI